VIELHSNQRRTREGELRAHVPYGIRIVETIATSSLQHRRCISNVNTILPPLNYFNSRHGQRLESKRSLANKSFTGKLDDQEYLPKTEWSTRAPLKIALTKRDLMRINIMVN